MSKMMNRITRWVDGNIGSSSAAMFVLAPLLAACTRRQLRELPQIYFNLHLRRRVRRLLPFLDPFVTVDITPDTGGVPYSVVDRAKSSHAYEEVKAYLSATCSRDARELHADGAADGDGFVLSLREGQEVADEFRGATVWWSSVPRRSSAGDGGHGLGLRLTFHQRHRELIVREYLPHVRRRGRDVMFGHRRRRLYTNKKGIDYVSSRNVWSYIDFDHPTTFDTLAMHPAKKRRIMDDLDDFRNNKDYYRRIGKAWKRGYLLYGPPGTGKSTLVAAMANYLNYDIYDIEMTMVQTNNDLRKLFIETKGKSIIVIEDIDCSLELTVRRRDPAPSSSGAAGGDVLQLLAAGASRKRDRPSTHVTLSGLLNFIDGLWSAHSGERIIVFTTNFVDKLDPALIRRGRMDVHVEMSYCCYEAFLTLAKNYLDVDAHPLFDSIRGLLETVEITPADVAECLMTSRHTDRGADACLGRLIDELKTKAAAQEKEKKEAEEKQQPTPATAAAAAVDAKPQDKSTNNGGRRVADARSTRRTAVEDKMKEAIMSAAAATGLTISSSGLNANGGAVNLTDNLAGGKARAQVSVKTTGTEAMALDGGSTADSEDDVSDYGGSGYNKDEYVDLSSDDDLGDDDCDDSDDDFDDDY